MTFEYLMKNPWTQKKAIILCSQIEVFRPMEDFIPINSYTLYPQKFLQHCILLSMIEDKLGVKNIEKNIFLEQKISLIYFVLALSFLTT